MIGEQPLRRVAKSAHRALGLLPPPYPVVVKGLLSYVPGLNRFADETHSISAHYCHGTWLKHIGAAGRAGLNADPKVIVELGPGSTLGVGMAGLLCGADKYYALDVIRRADHDTNLAALREHVKLLQDYAKTRHECQTPDATEPFLEQVLTPERLNKSLDPARVESIRKALSLALSGNGIGTSGSIEIVYLCPWSGVEIVEPHSVDMLTTTVVMQTIEDLDEVYGYFRTWLKPGGFMSHFLDYSNYGALKEWNGHWACSDFLWRLIRGNRPYLINRVPHSRHIDLMKKNGFEVVTHVQSKWASRIGRSDLAAQFEDMSDDDLTTNGAFVQARVPLEPVA